MPKIPVTAVFDIGKTNKKFFLFDQNLSEVYHSYTRLEPVMDEDGFPSEPVLPLRAWMLDTFRAACGANVIEGGWRDTHDLPEHKQRVRQVLDHRFKRPVLPYPANVREIEKGVIQIIKDRLSLGGIVGGVCRRGHVRSVLTQLCAFNTALV